MLLYYLLVEVFWSGKFKKNPYTLRQTETFVFWLLVAAFGFFLFVGLWALRDWIASLL